MPNEGFYDFHTHTVFSDGGMIPAGLMQRALVRGCLGLAITDHVDSSNLEWALKNLLKFVEELGQEWQPDIVPGGDGTTAPLNALDSDALAKNWHLPLIPGVELTSVPPRKMAALNLLNQGPTFKPMASSLLRQILIWARSFRAKASVGMP